MAVNVAAMRKGLLKQVYGECAVSSSYCYIVYRKKKPSGIDNFNFSEDIFFLKVAVLYTFCNFQEIVFYHVHKFYFQSCTNETKVSGEGETSLGAEAAPALLETEPTLWVCLQCGNQVRITTIRPLYIKVHLSLHLCSMN